MPFVHSLFDSPAGAAGAARLATKPSLLDPKPPPTKLDLPVPPPDLLPAHVKHKILSLEAMGVDSGRCLSLNPALRSAAPSSVQATISFLLSKGIHHKDLARIFGMCPGVLTASVPDDLAPVFAFLARDLGVSPSHFRRVVNKCPRLLACGGVRDQLRPALLFLQRLGFADPTAIAYRDPVLLVSSVERTLRPKLEFLVGLGMAREEAVAMVLRCPDLFTFSIERNFKPKFEYLVGDQMGRGLEEVKEFPQYFTFSLEKRIKPRNEEMRSRGVRLPLPVMLKSTDEQFKNLTRRRRRRKGRVQWPFSSLSVARKEEPEASAAAEVAGEEEIKEYGHSGT